MTTSGPLDGVSAGALAGAALQAVIQARYGGDDPVATAARYALEAGGKRVRPVLALLAADAVCRTPHRALAAAAALEMVHTYSLVHDDLPCMDDDDLRRGKPTTHKVFGEALALLAGDTLLTDAFAVVVEPPAANGLAGAVPDAAARADLVRELAAAAGGRGMVLGQALDLHWTARGGYTRADLEGIHARKTGCLLGAAVACGVIAGGGSPAQVDAARAFGAGVGLAFQILDDVLDVATGTGKSVGKDAAAGKLTFLSIMTPVAARAEADRLTTGAIATLKAAGLATAGLVDYARQLLDRRA